MYYIIIISLIYSYQYQYNHNRVKQRDWEKSPLMFYPVLLDQTYAENKF